MKIAIVSSSVYPANPDNYGSEWVNAYLAEELRKRHRVVFIAPAGSVGVDKLIPCTYGRIIPREERKAYDWYRELLLEQDCIVDWQATNRVAELFWFYEDHSIKVVASRNGVDFSYPRQPVGYPVVALSEYAKKASAGRATHVVPYGIPTRLFRSSDDRGYFLFLSRPTRDKGIFTFLRLARMMPEEEFVLAFHMAIPEHVEQGTEAIRMAEKLKNVRVVLSPDFKKKVDLYSHAKALVVPLSPRYREAFGLVAIEALASGTPVIYGDGAIREIIEHGRHGFIVGRGSLKDIAEAVKHVDEIDSKECIQHVRERFDISVMARRYEELCSGI